MVLLSYILLGPMLRNGIDVLAIAFFLSVTNGIVGFWLDLMYVNLEIFSTSKGVEIYDTNRASQNTYRSVSLGVFGLI
ncbi:hypothetical protein RchiOBHm_Chr6g0249141 [Rosa chinensis]|uniref:Uncharacterized protein n=1 Tax=Rosa chinensis TaxID=74649 RepID=A0A2P6PK80_ROSCH|nr:hypothetical protein RchiOBHm_Chr6g0249141 [Rosa chinensis]